MTVRLEQVSKIYNQVPVVNDLSFEIKKGEIFLIAVINPVALPAFNKRIQSTII